MDVRGHNREAWNRLAEWGDRWTQPVGPEGIAAARRGEWEILLSECRPVPREWFPDLEGKDVLCLAGGGGQQGPILAAAGARVTVFDNAPRQLERDREVAAREGLELATVEGDMRDLSALADGAFDLVVQPPSNLFVPEVRPVWREAFRVLRPGGELLAGFLNPVEYIFERPLMNQGEFRVRYALPYSDLESLSEKQRGELIGAGAPIEFSHTLEDQIGGQLDAGFVLIGLFEDDRREAPIARYMPSYIITRARRPPAAS